MGKNEKVEQQEDMKPLPVYGLSSLKREGPGFPTDEQEISQNLAAIERQLHIFNRQFAMAVKILGAMNNNFVAFIETNKPKSKIEVPGMSVKLPGA